MDFLAISHYLKEKMCQFLCVTQITSEENGKYFYKMWFEQCVTTR
jgi:hypothetical protein